MKILWFSNTPCSAIEKLTPKYTMGGWLQSLELKLTQLDEIELHIAFYFKDEMEPFYYNKTWFYPIQRKVPNSKILRYIKRIKKSNGEDKEEIQKIISITESIQPDLIHIHGTEENFGLIQYYTKIPVVVSIQGLINPITEKFFAGIPESKIEKYATLIDKVLIKTEKYNYQIFSRKRNAENEILKISKNIIGRTDWDKRVTRLLSPNSHYFIGNEILRQSFYELYWDKNCFNKKISLITITSNQLFKGFETILKTANLLRKNNFDFEWTIIGLDKSKSIVRISQKWLNINAEHENISFAGVKNEKEVLELLLSSDIYCQVSHIENSPNSLCEAMILGMPCIATFAGGTSSILENNIDGILVQDGDSYAFAGAIAELSYNYKMAKQMGATAREKALKRHNKENIVRDLVNIYKSCLNTCHWNISANLNNKSSI